MDLRPGRTAKRGGPKTSSPSSRAKQAAIAKLQAELDEARAVLAAYLDGMVQTHRAIGSTRQRRRGRERTRARLEQSPTAHEAATIIRAAGRRLHVTAIHKAMKRKGHAVAPATLVSALARWVRSAPSSTEPARRTSA